MPKDWRTAVLAIPLALPFWAAAGSAGAQDALTITTRIGAGIDHAQRARIGGTQGWVGAAEAIDLVTRPMTQRGPGRHPPQGSLTPPIGSLQGLLAPVGLDTAGLLRATGAAGVQAPAAQQTNRPMPYVRFGDGEQVFGLSFKIQPPPQVPETTSPRS